MARKAFLVDFGFAARVIADEELSREELAELAVEKVKQWMNEDGIGSFVNIDNVGKVTEDMECPCTEEDTDTVIGVSLQSRFEALVLECIGKFRALEKAHGIAEIDFSLHPNVEVPYVYFDTDREDVFSEVPQKIIFRKEEISIVSQSASAYIDDTYGDYFGIDKIFRLLEAVEACVKEGLKDSEKKKPGQEFSLILKESRAIEDISSYSDPMLLDSGTEMMYARLETPDGKIKVEAGVVVTGDVRVDYGDDTWTRPSMFPEELKQAFRNGEADNDPEIRILNNNWYEFVVTLTDTRTGRICRHEECVDIGFDTDTEEGHLKWLCDDLEELCIEEFGDVIEDVA